MPHIIIEHPEKSTLELNLNKLSKTLHNKLATFETITKSAIKTRTIAVNNVYVGGDETPNKFIHITLLLLEGRPQKLKEKIVKELFETATQLVSNTDYIITVETRDLGTYFKL